MVFALVSIWLLLLTFGTSAFLIPAAYSIKSALREAFTSIFVVGQWESPLEMLNAVGNTLLVGMGYLIGYPIASASGCDIRFLSIKLENEWIHLFISYISRKSS